MHAIAVADVFEISKINQLKAELAEAHDLILKFRTVFDACKEARDETGFSGTLPDCIRHLQTLLADEVKERRAAEARAAKQSEIAIRALSWARHGSDLCVAQSIVGTYHVTHQQWVLKGSNVVSAKCASDDAARADAQADYRRRVLSTLVASDQDDAPTSLPTANLASSNHDSRIQKAGIIRPNEDRLRTANGRDWADSISAIAAALPNNSDRDINTGKIQSWESNFEEVIPGHKNLPISELEWEGEFDKMLDGLFDRKANGRGDS